MTVKKKIQIQRRKILTNAKKCLVTSCVHTLWVLLVCPGAHFGNKCLIQILLNSEIILKKIYRKVTNFTVCLGHSMF